MKQDVDEVVCTGIKAEELAIEHMGQPGKRVPIESVGIDKGPNKSPPRQTVANSWTVKDIVVIVVLNEVKMSSRPIENKSQHG